MKLSIVSTLYYSQNYLDEFCQRCVSTAQAISADIEFILVNDGSPDQSLQKALDLQRNYPFITVVDLSRNFGHHRAIMTGLQHATGDYVFLIDSDLEENPELLKEFYQKIIDNPSLDVVYGLQTRRKGNWFERISGKIFYKVLSVLTSVEYPSDTFTARLMTSRYVRSVLQYAEKELDIWGVFVLTGYNQAGIPATKGFKGKSTYSFYKKLRIAVEIITSLSHRPLYLTFLLGIFITLISFGIIASLLYRKWINNIDVEGWASILASVWFLGGIILMVLGVIAIYLSKIFLEIKNRPLTIVRKVYQKP
ncbi:MAG: glycosyltransferase family 2 protein [Flammeovirgaceae bacterium]